MECRVHRSRILVSLLTNFSNRFKQRLQWSVRLNNNLVILDRIKIQYQVTVGNYKHPPGKIVCINYSITKRTKTTTCKVRILFYRVSEQSPFSVQLFLCYLFNIKDCASFLKGALTLLDAWCLIWQDFN